MSTVIATCVAAAYMPQQVTDCNHIDYRVSPVDGQDNPCPHDNKDMVNKEQVYQQDRPMTGLATVPLTKNLHPYSPIYLVCIHTAWRLPLNSWATHMSFALGFTSPPHKKFATPGDPSPPECPWPSQLSFQAPVSPAVLDRSKAPTPQLDFM